MRIKDFFGLDESKILEKLGIEQLYEDRILVMEESKEQKSAGGIIMPPQVTEEKLRVGYVLATGPGEFHNDGKPKVKMLVQTGDRIVFGKYEGSEFMIQGETLLCIRMLGVVMKLKPYNYNPNPDMKNERDTDYTGQALQASRQTEN